MAGSGSNVSSNLKFVAADIGNLGNYLVDYSYPYQDSAIGPDAIPEGGNAEIDQAMVTFFEGVTLLHKSAVYAMQNQGTKLQAAATYYQNGEDGVSQRIQALFIAAEEAPYTPLPAAQPKQG
jgi:hypothetical protein